MFGIADDILVAGFNELGRGYDKVLKICRNANLKSNKDKCPDPRILKALMNMPPTKCRNELQSFLVMIKLLSKFSPETTEVCELLTKLKSIKAEWHWIGTYQGLYNKAPKS